MSALKKFDRKAVKPGDLLCLTSHPDVMLRFKFMGLDGAVVATWVDPPDGPRDAILLQRQVRMVDSA